MNLARQLISLAKDNGGDLIKFQLYGHHQLYTNHPEIKNVELSQEQAFELFNYGKEVGIEVFFSVFDVERVKWCEEIKVKRYKIAARTHNFDLYTAIYNTGKPCIVSYDPNYDKWGWDNSWQVLYCVSEYPARNVKFTAGMFEDTGGVLGSSDGRGEYHRQYGGFSDHTIGLDAAKMALARGAQIIEKHFCINHQMGIDAKWSMTPAELQELKRWELLCQTVLSPS